MEENKNAPAFASTDGKTFANAGLTKREYAAIMIMQGMADVHKANSIICKQAIELADELFKQLNEKQNGKF